MEENARSLLNIHARGGLSPAHWQEVLKRIEKIDKKAWYDRWTYPFASSDGLSEWAWTDSSKAQKETEAIVAKVRVYAKKVIDGVFPDTDFHHRRYLGRRHLEFIRRCDTKDKAQIPSKLPFWHKTILVQNKLAAEVWLYAEFEKNGNYTLDDYVTSLGRIIMLNKGFMEWRKLRWSESEKVWHFYSAQSGAWSSGASGPEYVAENLVGNADPNLILNVWLLTNDDVPDPQHTPPDMLTEKLREQANIMPDQIQQRLRCRPELTNPWRERAYHGFVLGKASEKEQYLFSLSDFLGDEDEASIARKLQQIYQYHFGIRPFIVVYEPWVYTVAARDQLKGFVQMTGRVVAEGAIDHTSQLPEVSATLLEEEVT